MIIKNQLRKELIKSKISEIIESISSVEENLPENEEEFSNFGLMKKGIYKEIEFAIENVIDICNMINSDLRLGVPEVEEDIIHNLEVAKVFDKKIIELIKDLKKFRNILVHKYGKIDDKKAFEDISEGLNDFELIIKEIEGFLIKCEKNGKVNVNGKDEGKGKINGGDKVNGGGKDISKNKVNDNGKDEGQ